MALPPAAEPHTETPRTDIHLFRYLLFGVFAIGVGLRLNHYLGNRSLWLDEAMVALNLRDRSFSELLQPLDYDVLAPYGFLCIEKLAAELLGYTEYALRLYPLIAGVAALFLFYRLANKVIGKAAALVGLALFALSNWPIYYAAEVKQYSSDAMFALLLLLAAASPLEHWRRQRLLPLALLGFAAIWFSHPSVFVLTGIGLTFGLLHLSRKDWPRLRQTAAMSALWLLGFGISLIITPVGTSNVVDHMQEIHWGSYFMPWPPRPGWLLDSIFEVFRQPVGFPLNGLALFLFLVGAYSLWTRNRPWLSLLVAPILAALAASSLHLYPFTGRLLLFIVPGVLIVLAEGIEFLRGALWRSRRRFAWAALVGLLALHPAIRAFNVAAEPAPYEREDMKGVLEYIRQHSLPGDHIYVYYGAERAFRYYASLYKLDGHTTVFGKLPRSPDDFLADAVNHQTGGRTWLVFTHVLDRIGLDERRFLTYFFDSAGSRLDVREAKGASAYLYDLPPEGMESVRLLQQKRLVNHADSGR